ncbi:MAG: DUF2357 domain-containing protein [bacterium]
MHPAIEQLYPEGRDYNIKASIEIEAVGCQVEKFSYYTPTAGLKESKSLNPEVYPCFYEQQNYLVFIESKNRGKKEVGEDTELSFFHENKQIREAVNQSPGKNNQLMGIINFRNDVGLSELEIRGNGQPLLLITIEVFPSKIDYQSDYYSLLQEINHDIYNLAYDFLRTTFQGARLEEAVETTLTEFYSIIRIIFNKFIKAYHRIESYPHHRLNKTATVLPASRVKKINHQSIKWLRKNQRFYDKKSGLPTKMLNIDKQISFDTFENRFVKWIITRLLKRLKTFKQRYKKYYNERMEPVVIQVVDEMKKKLNFILKTSFLQDVGDLYKIDSLSLVLQMAPGYREIYKYYLMLQKGLSINGEIFRLSMKQISELYEYWCFLELNKILTKKYKLLKHDLIDVNYTGIYVKLNKGSSSTIKYENPKTKEKFALTYNQKEGEKITTGQKPDNILTLNKEGSDVEYKFVFDAKYRINPAYPDTHYYKCYHGIPGPEEDTINTMHRYRDAIVQSNENSTDRIVVGAFVLFPYHDEVRFKEHHFYKSITEVNVGAFPFLPGSTSLLSKFLENIIEESYLGNYERNILPAGSDQYQNDIKFEQNVLVGSIRNKRQFDIITEKNFYYIPYQQNILNHDLDYIAIYQSERRFKEDCGVKYYGYIKSIDINKRKEIKVPTKRNLDKNYIVFIIDKWEKLDVSIKPEGYGVSGSHIYTNIMLLEKARTIPELSIKSLEEWRTWLELKRIKPEIEVLLTGKRLSTDSRLKGFKLKNMIVKIEDGSVYIDRNDRTDIFSRHDFLYNLRGVIKEIFSDNEKDNKKGEGK